MNINYRGVVGILVFILGSVLGGCNKAPDADDVEKVLKLKESLECGPENSPLFSVSDVKLVDPAMNSINNLKTTSDIGNVMLNIKAPNYIPKPMSNIKTPSSTENSISQLLYLIKYKFTLMLFKIKYGVTLSPNVSTSPVYEVGYEFTLKYNGPTIGGGHSTYESTSPSTMYKASKGVFDSATRQLNTAKDNVAHASAEVLDAAKKSLVESQERLDAAKHNMDGWMARLNENKPIINTGNEVADKYNQAREGCSSTQLNALHNLLRGEYLEHDKTYPFHGRMMMQKYDGEWIKK